MDRQHIFVLFVEEKRKNERKREKGRSIESNRNRVFGFVIVWYEMTKKKYNSNKKQQQHLTHGYKTPYLTLAICVRSPSNVCIDIFGLARRISKTV